MEKLWKKLGIEKSRVFLKKNDNEKTVKQQSNSTFNDIQKHYTNYDRCTF